MKTIITIIAIAFLTACSTPEVEDNTINSQGNVITANTYEITSLGNTSQYSYIHFYDTFDSGSLPTIYTMRVNENTIPSKTSARLGLRFTLPNNTKLVVFNGINN